MKNSSYEETIDNYRKKKAENIPIHNKERKRGELKTHSI